ncbi:MAG: type II toxin-antitoxin system HicB family antitoxin [Elainella sp.]
MFRYKNYIGKPEVDTETRLIHGRLLNITDVIEFEGSTVEQAEGDFRRAVDAYLKFCEDQGKEPEKPFSGKLPFRTSPEIHRDIYIAASRADRSINAWMEEILCNAARNLNQPAVPSVEIEGEPSLAEYRFLLTRLQEKINLLQNKLEPYLKQELGIFPDLLNDIKPILKDQELPDLIDRVEQMNKRLESLRDQEASLLPFIEKPVVETPVPEPAPATAPAEAEQPTAEASYSPARFEEPTRRR